MTTYEEDQARRKEYNKRPEVRERNRKAFKKWYSVPANKEKHKARQRKKALRAAVHKLNKRCEDVLGMDITCVLKGQLKLSEESKE